VLALCAMLAGLLLWNPLGLGTSPQAASLTKNIEDIRPGDQVMAWDEDTGEMVPRQVVRTFHNTSDHLRILTIRNADGSVQEIKTTDGHPFWVPDEGWVDAGELHAGDRLLQSDGNAATIVTSQYESHPKGVAIFNFEVEDCHTYGVADDDALAHVVVHNMSKRRSRRTGGAAPPNLAPPGAGRRGAFRAAKRHLGIPQSAQPCEVRTVPDRTNPGRTVREYDFEVPQPYGGPPKRETIQDHYNGHRYPDDPSQDRGPHFNTPDGGHFDY
jgi:hypothetical protein